ncbi:8-oxo-dGTP diphosphatase [Sebaldella sp. S0638]|nr:8-oxo-dGTP diphosphatase [Sebaldella sp. S0638]MCP1224303.1 8-oxo-dGTP diphosphatase [Sebaldella sp. S0638]
MIIRNKNFGQKIEKELKLLKLATLCYIKKDGKTLMLHRTKKENDMHEGKWVGVGGKIEKGESPEECAVREVFEETGLKAEELKLRGLLTFPDFNSSEDWYGYLYVVEKFSGELIESPEGDLKWIEDSKLFDLDMWEGDELFMRWMLEDRMFSAKFIYDENERMKDYSVTFYE